MAHSHLYKTPDALVSTFQRVDLPLVPLLDQYTYVLYTDADVYFRRPIHLEDFGGSGGPAWVGAYMASLPVSYYLLPLHPPDAPLAGLPLPRSISMSHEVHEMFPYNAGVILANLPVMRENYKVGAGQGGKVDVGMRSCGRVCGVPLVWTARSCNGLEFVL